MKTTKKILALILGILILTSSFAISASAVSNTRYSVLVLDVSGSMSGSPVAELKVAATKFCEEVLKSNRSNNKIAIVSFASSDKTVCDFTDDLTTLKDGIDNLYASGGTNLAPALSTAKNMLDGVDSNAIKNVLVMCDGDPWDTSSAYSVVKTYPLHWNVYGLYFYQAGYSNGAATVMKTVGRNGYYEVKDGDALSFTFATEWSGNVTTKDANKVVVRIACPVDVYVTLNGQTLSQSNPQTTFGTLDITTDASGDEIKTLTLAYNNEYDIQIDGYDTGTMDCTIDYFCNDDSLFNVTYPTVNVTENTKISTHIDVGNSRITLDVDADGDGVVDNQVAPNVSTSNFFYRLRNFFKELFYKIREFFNGILGISFK